MLQVRPQETATCTLRVRGDAYMRSEFCNHIAHPFGNQTSSDILLNGGSLPDMKETSDLKFSFKPSLELWKRTES